MRGRAAVDSPDDHAAFGVREPRKGLAEIIAIVVGQLAAPPVVAGAFEVEEQFFRLPVVDELLYARKALRNQLVEDLARSADASDVIHVFAPAALILPHA
ncbi:MAG: hypothetical protein BWY66_01755 [bacterium ADurb.Bin374]|nr:MAG: hypothetical protein BWY66_01755 [bacterium ADurb.Bin374]